MPKETFGGDGDDEGAEEKKKLGLDKFNLSPDTNIRDLFWKIMGSYAAAKKPGVELASLEHDRFALMRVAVSVLSNPDSEHFGMSPRFVAMYTTTMMLEAGWKDVVPEFLNVSLEPRLKIKEHVKASLKKLIAQDKYREMLFGIIANMLRKTDTTPVALAYISELGAPELSLMVKKELIIFARGDIGENQQNAISAIATIKEDPDVKKSFIILLSHWDKEARRAAAGYLVGMEDDDVKAAAKKRIELESDEEIKKILMRIAK